MLTPMRNYTVGIEPTSLSTTMPLVESCDFTKLIVHSVVGGFICIVGFAGNIVSMFILGKDKQSPVATSMLQWLAMTDNIFITLWTVHFPMKYFIEYTASITHPIWLLVRVYTYPLLFIAQMATIWITVVIAAGRYVAVCLPYKAMHYVTPAYTRRVIVFTWMTAIFYNIPRFFEVTVAFNSTNNSIAEYRHTTLGLNPMYKLIYFHILYYLTSFILPLLLLAILNTKLIISYR